MSVFPIVLFVLLVAYGLVVLYWINPVLLAVVASIGFAIIILTGLLGLSFVSSRECEFYSVPVPEPTPEDRRLCATAYYPLRCYEALGYKLVSSCLVGNERNQ